MTTLEEISALTRPNHPDDWTELDSRAVDTVRVLAADAVQKVGNGHPGTAMSLAPLAYTLFQRQMRHDPSDLHWLGRDRFVLSAGHSSLTLYIQLYLGGFGLELSDIESLRTWGSRTPGHPGVPPHPGRGDHHRTARPGPGVGRRDGDGVALRARPVRPGRRTRHQPVRPLHLCDRLRRRHRGGRDERGVVAGRHPAARQPDRVLRRQPDLHRGRHQHRAVRGHPGPLRGLRLARAGRRGRRERGRHRGGDRGGQGRHRQAVVHRGAHHHRLSGAEQDEHRQGARLGARRRGGRRGQEDSRLRPGQDVRGARRGASSTPASLVARGKEAHEKWQQRVRRLGRSAKPERKALLDRLLAQELPDGWDADLPYWEPGSKALATRAAFGAGAHRVGAEAARAVGRVRGPGRQQQHHDQGRRLVRSAVDLDQGVHG